MSKASSLYRRRCRKKTGAGDSLIARLNNTTTMPTLMKIVRDFIVDVDVDVDVVDLRAQADASMPASNNNVKLYNISNF